MRQVEQLIHMFSRLPGLGPKSARRAVLYMLQNPQHYMHPLSDAIKKAADTIQHCQYCGNLDNDSPCHICCDNKRHHNILCVVEQVADLWALERMGQYRGLYHILGGVLSPLDNIGPEDLRINELLNRCYHIDTNYSFEIIIATNLTVDGQTTAHYIAQQLKKLPQYEHMNITRIAHGVPVGGELDYWDEGTLFAAINARQNMI